MPIIKCGKMVLGISDALSDYIDQLSKLGTYGLDPQETVDRLLSQRMEQLIEEGILVRYSPSPLPVPEHIDTGKIIRCPNCGEYGGKDAFLVPE